MFSTMFKASFPLVIGLVGAGFATADDKFVPLSRIPNASGSMAIDSQSVPSGDALFQLWRNGNKVGKLASGTILTNSVPAPTTSPSALPLTPGSGTRNMADAARPAGANPGVPLSPPLPSDGRESDGVLSLTANESAANINTIFNAGLKSFQTTITKECRDATLKNVKAVANCPELRESITTFPKGMLESLRERAAAIEVYGPDGQPSEKKRAQKEFLEKLANEWEQERAEIAKATKDKVVEAVVKSIESAHP